MLLKNSTAEDGETILDLAGERKLIGDFGKSHCSGGYGWGVNTVVKERLGGEEVERAVATDLSRSVSVQRDGGMGWNWRGMWDGKRLLFLQNGQYYHVLV